MKKIFYSLIAVLLLLIGMPTVNAEKDKVKVYVFEAGGCPYCEYQKEYFEGLESYGEKFEIVSKELYVDHVDWEKGADFELGKAVAEAFQSKGYPKAGYDGTPFVVISNIYAAATYNPELEATIDAAYEAGDTDIVECFENGEEDCVKKIKKYVAPEGEETPTETEGTSTTEVIIVLGIIFVVIAGCTGLIIVSRKQN